MWQLYSTLESPMAAAHTLAKPNPGAHIREPNVMNSSCASYVLATAMARRNASSFIGRKASWADPCRHRSQRRIDQGRSPGGLLAAWGLEAFRHGDEALSTKHAELEEVPVGLNFHSTDGECNGVECWDPSNDAAKGNVERSESGKGAICGAPKHRPRQGHHPFNCYFPPLSIVARLFGPAIFEASKLKVLFLGVDEEKHPGNLPRAYTLTHSDITAKLTLAVSQTINKAQLQGWYNRLQRDEVVAEWRKAQGKMSLHVHCHISGGHWLLDAIAHLRFYIFRKELPVVLEAFRHGDEALFNNHPELEEALVWVYFHSNAKEFNRVECWGPLRDAAKGGGGQTESAREAIHNAVEEMGRKRPKRCPEPCNCCYPPFSLIPWPDDCETQL